MTWQDSTALVEQRDGLLAQASALKIVDDAYRQADAMVAEREKTAERV